MYVIICRNYDNGDISPKMISDITSISEFDKKVSITTVNSGERYFKRPNAESKISSITFDIMNSNTDKKVMPQLVLKRLEKIDIN